MTNEALYKKTMNMPSRQVKGTTEPTDQTYGIREFGLCDINGVEIVFGQDIDKWVDESTAHRRTHETSHWHRRHLLQGQRRSSTAGLVQAAPGNRCPSLGRSCLHVDRRRGQAGCRHNGLVHRSARRRSVCSERCALHGQLPSGRPPCPGQGLEGRRLSCARED